VKYIPRVVVNGRTTPSDSFVKSDQSTRSSSADRSLPQRGAPSAPSNGGGLRKVQSGDMSLSTFARNNPSSTQMNRPASMTRIGMIPTGRNGTMNQGGPSPNAVWATAENVTKPSTKLVKYIPRVVVNGRTTPSESFVKSDQSTRSSSAERSLPQRGAPAAPPNGGGLRKVQSGDMSLSTFARNNPSSTQMNRPASMTRIGMITTGRNDSMNQAGRPSPNAVWAKAESITKPSTKLVKYIPRASNGSFDKSDRSNRSNRSSSSDRSLPQRGTEATPVNDGELRKVQSAEMDDRNNGLIPSSQNNDKPFQFDLSASLSRIDAITATMQQNNATYGVPARRPGANAVWSVLSPVTESVPRKLSSKLVKHHLLPTATSSASMMMNRASTTNSSTYMYGEGLEDGGTVGSATEKVQQQPRKKGGEADEPPPHAMTKKKKKDRSSGSLKNSSNSDLSYCSSSSGSGSKLLLTGTGSTSKKKKSPPTKRVDMSGLASLPRYSLNSENTTP
jgi:hypothetical protein